MKNKIKFVFLLLILSLPLLVSCTPEEEPADPVTELIDAISNKDTELALELIEKGYPLNNKPGKVQPLHKAIDGMLFDVIYAMIEAGADLEIKNFRWDTAITHFVEKVEKGDFTKYEAVKVFTKFLDAGADLSLITINDQPIGHYFYFDKAFLQTLFKKNQNNINRLWEGRSLLARLCAEGNIEVATFFLEQGANPNRGYGLDNHPYMISSANGIEPLKDILISYGANLALKDRDGISLEEYDIFYDPAFSFSIDDLPLTFDPQEIKETYGLSFEIENREDTGFLAYYQNGREVTKTTSMITVSSGDANIKHDFLIRNVYPQDENRIFYWELFQVEKIGVGEIDGDEKIDIVFVGIKINYGEASSTTMIVNSRQAQWFSFNGSELIHMYTFELDNISATHPDYSYENLYLLKYDDEMKMLSRIVHVQRPRRIDGSEAGDTWGFIPQYTMVKKFNEDMIP